MKTRSIHSINVCHLHLAIVGTGCCLTRLATPSAPIKGNPRAKDKPALAAGAVELPDDLAPVVLVGLVPRRPDP